MNVRSERRRAAFATKIDRAESETSPAPPACSVSATQLYLPERAGLFQPNVSSDTCQTDDKNLTVYGGLSGRAVCLETGFL